MKELKNSIAYRKNILENLIDKPPFRYDKRTSSDGGSIDIKESENVVNISFTRNRVDASPSNERCRTTINLYINDSCNVQTKCEGCACNTRKNEAVLGKNIPNHNLMENLLGDLYVKKFSSAPNMDQVKNDLPKSLKTTWIRNSRGNTLKTENTETENEKMSLLYMNDKRCGGDFQKTSTEELMRKMMEEIKKIPECDSIQHGLDESFFKGECDTSTLNLESRSQSIRSEEKLKPDAPLKENSGILYRDTMENETATVEKLTQPKRKLPAFRFRTRMVRDNINAKPENAKTYYSKLIKNHNKMFETLRHVNFQEEAQKKDVESSLIDINGSIKNWNLNPDQNEDDTNNDELLTYTTKTNELNEIEKVQQQDLLNDGKPKTVCSIQSHGSYDVYKRNLIRRPDGSMCCRMLKGSDDDTWSRAETRNIITSEFIKDKVRRFEKIAKKKNLHPEYMPSNETNTTEEINSIKNVLEKSWDLSLVPEKESPSLALLNENVQSISFPKETKNAMRRLLAENLDNNPKYNRLKARVRKWNNQLESHKASQSTKLRPTMTGKEDKNIGFWPRTAERVPPRPEVNLP